MTDVRIGHHAKALSDDGSRMAGRSLKLPELCNWHVSTECCNHVSHMKDKTSNDQLMKYMRAIILSCRSTTSFLAEYRERWIVSHLVLRDWAFESSYHVWTLIGVDSTVCDLILTLQLRVTGASIWVEEDHANDDESFFVSMVCPCRQCCRAGFHFVKVSFVYVYPLRIIAPNTRPK